MTKRSQLIAILAGAAVVVAAAIIAAIAFRPDRDQILVVLPTADNPFWAEMKAGAEEAAASLKSKASVVIRTGAADSDAKTQIQVLRDYLRSSKVSALVLGPASSTEVVPEVARYNQAKIPVVVVDSRLDSGELTSRGASVDLFIGSNNVQGGRLAAEELARMLDSGKHIVLLIEGSAGHETAIARSKGFREAVPPTWNVVRKDGNWERGRAREIMEAALNTGKPDAVFACSDEMALGAITALESTGLNRIAWPIVVGFDATADGVAAVRDGRMAATIKQNPKEIGEQGVKDAYELATGNRTVGGDRLLDVSVVRR